MHQFNETHPEFAGFSNYYETTLKSSLVDIEKQRKNAIPKLHISRLFALAIILGACGLVMKIPISIWMKLWGCWGIILMVCSGFGGIHRRLMREVRANTKAHLVSGICDFIGWSFSEQLDEKPRINRLTENGLLLKNFSRSSFEDQMRGNVHGANFLSVECHLEHRRGDGNSQKNWVTGFRGLIMVIDFHRKFAGRTVVLRDRGILNVKRKNGMKRVGLVDPKFERIFEAYGTDQVEARYLLTPVVMERLMDLEHAVDGRNLRFGFLDDRLYITVETENRFETGSMALPITDVERTQNLLDEIGAVYNLVDGVMAI